MTEHKMDIEVGMTLDEFFKELDNETWVAKLRYFPSRMRARAKRRWFDFKWRCQRFAHGHADEDLWNLNWALARLVVAGTGGMLEWGHGHPIGMEPDEWDDVLRDIRDGFDIWMKRDGVIVLPFEQSQFTRAATLLAEHFDALWD